MTAVTSAGDSSWKNSYTAALFQDDTNKIPMLVARAESEIVARARTLFEAPGDDAGEMRALHNALQILHVLKKCTGLPHPADRSQPVHAPQVVALRS